MKGMLFLLISIVLTFIAIIVVPLGLAKKEKMILAISASLIGTIGLMSTFIAEIWQVSTFMLLLAISSGYIISSRFTSADSPVPLRVRLHSNREFDGYDDTVNKSHPRKDKEDDFVLQPITVKPAVNLPDIEEQQVLPVEDISFLEDRNTLDNVNPINYAGVYNIDSSEPYEEDSWVVEEAEPEPEKVYAGSHS